MLTRTPHAGWFRSVAVVAVVVFLLAATGCGGDDDAEPLKLAYLGDLSGDLGEFGPQIQQGVELAIEHLNAAGGVGGEPVELAVADTRSEPNTAVEEARRLVEDEGVHAIIGPLGTAPALAVAEQISGPLRILTISPSATSPALSDVDDGGFLYRTAISDAAQGPILAQLVIADLEFEDIAVLHEDSVYGRGLLATFEAAYPGRVTSVPYAQGQASYRTELEAASVGAAPALVAIGYPTEAIVFVREAIEDGLFESFVFVDGTRSIEMIEALGADRLEGSKGTAPSTGPQTEATRAFDDAFLERFGALPATPFVREAYDATIAIGLAAEAADSFEGSALVASLEQVANPPGAVVTPGVASLTTGLASLRDGDEVNYRGAASEVDWDDQGDLATGFVGIWAYQGGTVVELETIPFDLR